MTGAGDRRILTGWWLAGFALLLSGCAAPIRSFGTLAMPRSDHTFTMATGGPADVDAAVGNALVAAGYRSAADARYRVEVGLAVRAPHMNVMAATEDGKTMRPLAPVSSPPGLCQRRSYVLSIAFVDRASGHVEARGGAITSRCGKAGVAGFLPLLAKAALGNANPS